MKWPREWRKIWDEFGIQGDEFIRTTDLAARAARCNGFFKRCRENGYVYKGHYTGQYCVFDNAYVNDAGPGDPCPDCGRPTETVTRRKLFLQTFRISESVCSNFTRSIRNLFSPKRAETKC